MIGIAAFLKSKFNRTYQSWQSSKLKISLIRGTMWGMDPQYDHNKFESEIYQKWEKSGAFTPTPDKNKKPLPSDASAQCPVTRFI